MAAFMSLLGATNVQVSGVRGARCASKGVADAIVFRGTRSSPFGIDKVVKFHNDHKLYASTLRGR